MNPTDEIASSGPVGTFTPSGASSRFHRSERQRWTISCRPSQPPRYGAKSAHRSSERLSRSWVYSDALGHTSQVQSASMPRERTRLIARRMSVRELAAKDGARRVIEQPHDRGMAELLVDPGQAGRRLLQVADLMRIAGHAARDAGFEQMASRFCLTLAMKPADRAEVDDEGADPPQRPSQLVVAPQRLVALGMGQDRDFPLEAQLEQLIDHSRGHERGWDLDQEGRSITIVGNLILGDPPDEHIIPHTLGSEPQRGVPRLAGALDGSQGFFDPVPARQVLT